MPGTFRHPIIAITTKLVEEKDPFLPGEAAAQIGYWYVQKVQQAGGIPILIPPCEEVDQSCLQDLLSRIDGIILTGGVDVNPALYGQEMHPRTDQPRPERDNLDFALLAAAEEKGIPILGICRGMQVMAVSHGGSLIQHLPEVYPDALHNLPDNQYVLHEVELSEGTKLAEILNSGIPKVSVYSKHHQCVQTHPGYISSAVSEDGVIEAIEKPENLFQLGVQWHPEVGSDPRIFEELINAAKEFSQNRKDS
ncbi:gamma-glutamyl-gamma-aminobutyrate hydrolase family protein [Actinomycetaceae bacterium TAE3-ERU4]|nr:gamma-glutamyl-gamma-aminobutyrate hydrolase family protein [Actinomycetaceae bacterium TAE3-ERU4]